MCRCASFGRAVTAFRPNTVVSRRFPSRIPCGRVRSSAAEAFTAGDDEWKQYPGAMKPQGDWALCAGINRFVFHRYQHQPWLDRSRHDVGTVRRSLGAHRRRGGTWRRLSRLSRALPDLLRQRPAGGRHPVPRREGAPHVFRPPVSATPGGLPDRRGYNFDGCAPDTLIAGPR